MKSSSGIITPLGNSLPRGAWLVVMFLFIVGALNYIDRNMLTTMRFSIMDSIPMSDAQFGLLTSVFLWVYGLMSPLAGYLADKFKRSHIIIFSLLVWSLVTWMTGHATTVNQLLVSRALMGVSEAFYMPAALALITDYHRGPTQSRATGINLAGVMLGSSLGFIGGWIAEKYTWNLAFNSFGIIGIVYAVILFLFLKDAPKNDISSLSDCSVKKDENRISFIDAIKNLFSKSAYIYLLIFWGFLGLVNWMVVAWLPTYYKETFNLSQSMAGVYATAYFWPASIIGLLAGGYLSDRWSKKNPLARVIIPLIGLMFAVPAIFSGSVTAVLGITVSAFAVYALTSKFTDTNMMPMLCLIIDHRYRATGYGILNMLSTIIGGLGVYIAGAMRDVQIGLSLVYQACAIALIVCAGILFLVLKTAKKRN
ncbi:MFS transporter [Proteiniphilum sp. UBA7639]|jgi:MFS family permease|uniref:MFS transporter n=1 Tax=Proteiniphilum sp. UBA7639 TaxID=1947289 RepID=UPI000EECF27E|nr:MFS transporter [Proteiniphilum sp. UBA7639]HCS75812.1 MFS transporter [Clostridiales bacterium]